MTTPLPKLGTQQRLVQHDKPVPNDRTPDWSGWYPTKAAIDPPQDPPTVTIDGEGGGVDIGGNPDRPGRLVLRDLNGRITQIVDGQSGDSDQLGNLVLSTFETETAGASFNNVHERIRLSGKDGTVTLKTKGVSGKETIHLDGNQGDLVLGNTGVPGNVVVMDAGALPGVSLDGGKGTVFVKSALSVAKPQADPGAALDVSGKTQTTSLVVKQEAQTQTLRVDGSAAVAKPQADLGVALDVNGKTQANSLVVKQEAQTQTLRVDGSAAVAKPQADPGVALDVNGKTQANSLVVKQEAQTQTLRVDGSAAVAKQQAEPGVALDVNGKTQTTNLEVEQSTQTKRLRVTEKAVVGTSEAGGSVALDVQGITRLSTLEVDGSATAQSLKVGAKAIATDVEVTNSLTVDGVTTVKSLTISDVMAMLKVLRIEIGDSKVEGDLAVRGKISVNSAKGTTILDGGDIHLSNADCAEDFDVTDVVDPGTVMVLNDSGALRQSSAAYDKRVAGVISGAGGYRPGLVLDKQQVGDRCRLPVALMGKVFCKVDADHAPIEVGDLLTTSHTPGHAMKAADPFRAFGAVIGKALQPLSAGQGLIPVLVALQ